MGDPIAEKLREYVFEHCGSNAHEILRKMSLAKALSRMLGCACHLKSSSSHEGYFRMVLIKDFDMNEVVLNDVIVWHSRKEEPLHKLFDVFLNEFKSRNAYHATFDFENDQGSCTLKLNVPYYESDDELQTQAVLAGKWVDIETA